MSSTTWAKFYWADWSSDPCLRLCSRAAKGLWIDMLCIAAQADPVGYVVVAGRGLDAAGIAAVCGGTAEEVAPLLAELERNNVFSRDRAGKIMSRRMIRDAKKAAEGRKNGKRGGNPNLGNNKQNPPTLNPKSADGLAPLEDHPETSGRANPPLPETKTDPAIAVPFCDAAPAIEIPPKRTDADWRALEYALREAAGATRNVNPSASLADCSAIVGLIDGGYDLETDILPAIRSRPKPELRSWNYYTNAIVDFKRNRQSATVLALTPNDPRKSDFVRDGPRKAQDQVAIESEFFMSGRSTF